MSDLSWVTNAPIRELKGPEVQLALDKMKETMGGWNPVELPRNPIKPYLPPAPRQSPEDVRRQQLTRQPPDIDVSDWQRPPRTFQERWNQRIGSTRQMFNMAWDTDPDKSHVVGYFLTGVPVALMALRITFDPLFVADLVSHPGAEQAGGIMIEYAVNYGQQKKGDPKLELYALDEDARRAYLALGFVSAPDSPRHMSLDPANSGVWTQLSGRWHLTKYASAQNFRA